MPKKSRSRRRTSPRSRRRSGRRINGGLFGFARRHWKWGLIPLLLAVAGVVYLDFAVRSKFEGKKWALPARVYARPLELYAGQSLRPAELRAELRALGYQFTGSATKPGQAADRGDEFEIATRGFNFWDKREPARRLEIRFAGSVITAVRNPADPALSIARLEPREIGGIYPQHMEDRLLVRLEDIPPVLGEALIAVEDRDFLDHHGVSPKAIARAAWANLRSGGVVQGGSTITQQLVKNFYLNQDRSLTRKGLEAIMAIQLDAHYGKAEILETYINEVYLGQSGARGIHGFALGAQHYFRQPLAELRLDQIALLVGLVKGASFYNPWKHPQRATERRNLVLAVMHETGLIDAEQLAAASARALDIVTDPGAGPYNYPAFIELVKRQLRRDYEDEDLRSEGLRVFTTLSPAIQQRAETALTRRLKRLEADYELPDDQLQGAVVVTGVGNGEVLALVGDRHSQYAGFNRALDARRAIGSLVKPAVYLTALARPERYTLVTPVDDSEVSVFTDAGNIWRPRNFTREEHGEVPLYEALSSSYNQATARLGMAVGLDEVIDNLYRLGLEKDIERVPSVLLGAVDLSPWEVSSLYQTIAGEGVHTPQRAILSVLNAQGQPLNRYPLRPENRFDASLMHLVEYALMATLREGTGRGAYRELPQDWYAAGKTGTTNDQRDSWFAGYSGDHLAVVWVGRDDYGPTPLTGATGALRVWSDLFTGISSRPLLPVKPADIAYAWVDPAAGTLSGRNCKGAKYMPFIKGSEPRVKGPCEYRENPMLFWLKDMLGD